MDFTILSKEEMEQIKSSCWVLIDGQWVWVDDPGGNNGENQ